MFLNIRIVGSRDIQLSHAAFRGQNVSNAIDLTNLSIITILLSIVKQTSRLILPDLNQSRTNHACTHSNAWNIRVTIKQTQILALSKDINSTKSDIQRNTKNSIHSAISEVQAWLSKISSSFYKTFIRIEF